MLGPKEFIANKASVVGMGLEISGTEVDLVAGALGPMMPLAASDVFQLQIGSEIDLELLKTLISVTPEPGERMNDLLDYVDMEGAIDVEALLIVSSLKFDSEEALEVDKALTETDEIFRNAIILSPDSTWLIVGSRSGEKVLTVLRDAWSE
jgi:hypothetical protein